mmetsp:Transcript_114709/g.357271  ORF Transcript_114709/g.357271 Transcript_114709/m.357271 type:complete len:229 (+) Transcript_114709:457-1143(+)
MEPSKDCSMWSTWVWLWSASCRVFTCMKSPGSHGLMLDDASCINSSRETCVTDAMPSAGTAAETGPRPELPMERALLHRPDVPTASLSMPDTAVGGREASQGAPAAASRAAVAPRKARRPPPPSASPRNSSSAGEELWGWLGRQSAPPQPAVATAGAPSPGGGCSNGCGASGGSGPSSGSLCCFGLPNKAPKRPAKHLSTMAFRQACKAYFYFPDNGQPRKFISFALA